MQPEFMEDREEAMDRVERIVQYRFRNRQLLEEALTHISFFNNCGGRSNARLAYIGDAVVYLLYAKKFYCQDHDAGSDKLTELRKRWIEGEKQARVAVHHELYPLLRRSYCPGLDPKVSQFTIAVKKEPPEENLGKLFPRMLAEMVEAIVGAVYVDSKFELEVADKVAGLLFQEETFQCSSNHWPKRMFRGILAAFVISCTLAAMNTSSDQAIIYVAFFVGFAGFAWFCLKILLCVQEERRRLWEMYVDPQSAPDGDDEEEGADEIKEAKVQTMNSLIAGQISVVNGRDTNSFWCPICSPRQKTKHWSIQELLNHARSPSSRGRSGTEYLGQHRAIVQYVENNY